MAIEMVLGNTVVETKKLACRLCGDRVYTRCVLCYAVICEECLCLCESRFVRLPNGVTHSLADAWKRGQSDCGVEYDRHAAKYFTSASAAGGKRCRKCFDPAADAERLGGWGHESVDVEVDASDPIWQIKRARAPKERQAEFVVDLAEVISFRADREPTPRDVLELDALLLGADVEERLARLERACLDAQARVRCLNVEAEIATGEERIGILAAADQVRTQLQDLVQAHTAERCAAAAYRAIFPSLAPAPAAKPKRANRRPRPAPLAPDWVIVALERQASALPPRPRDTWVLPVLQFAPGARVYRQAQ